MNRIIKAKKSLEKKTKKGFRGYPVGTIAFYGPNNKVASKVSAGIIAQEGAEPKLQRWYSEVDVRRDAYIMKEVLNFIRNNAARSVVMVDQIIGCPHEEGIDYPEAESCPECPYWLNRDRWTHEYIH